MYLLSVDRSNESRVRRCIHSVRKMETLKEVISCNSVCTWNRNPEQVSVRFGIDVTSKNFRANNILVHTDSQPMIRGSNLGRGEGFFTSPKHPLSLLGAQPTGQKN